MTGGELFDRIVEKGSYSEKDAADLIRQVKPSCSSLADFFFLGGGDLVDICNKFTIKTVNTTIKIFIDSCFLIAKC